MRLNRSLVNTHTWVSTLNVRFLFKNSFSNAKSGLVVSNCLFKSFRRDKFWILIIIFSFEFTYRRPFDNIFVFRIKSDITSHFFQVILSRNFSRSLVLGDLQSWFLVNFHFFLLKSVCLNLYRNLGNLKNFCRLSSKDLVHFINFFESFVKFLHIQRFMKIFWFWFWSRNPSLRFWDLVMFEIKHLFDHIICF